MVRLLVVLGALASLAVARPALACSRAADSTALRTIPAQGAEGVPTDVAILVNVETMHLESQDTLPSGFCTLRTQDGEIVPTTTERIAWWHGEVRPIAPLTPHSTYALEVQIPRWDGSTVARTMTFTTGGGPLDVALEPPVAKLYSWQLARHVQETSCEFPIGTCLAIPPGEVVQVLFTWRALTMRAAPPTNPGPKEAAPCHAAPAQGVECHSRCCWGCRCWP